MKEINTDVQLYDIEEITDYHGTWFATMEPMEDGRWVNVVDHDKIVMALKDRVTYLENVCDEQVRMLTGD